MALLLVLTVEKDCPDLWVVARPSHVAGSLIHIEAELYHPSGYGLLPSANSSEDTITSQARLVSDPGDSWVLSEVKTAFKTPWIFVQALPWCVLRPRKCSARTPSRSCCRSASSETPAAA